MARIFQISDDSTLVSMEETPYRSEDLLQELLARYPDLLAGEQINSQEPRRWLLVTREMSVPGEENGAGRWSLDHLFLDQDAIPTLVEVKRSTDTRIRREVVGQMLDYAANAVVYWPVDEIRAKFEGRCEKDGVDASQLLTELLGEERDVNDFWRQVKTNLQAGRIRMVFVADLIPPELRQIVEFLNSQMDPAEVIAIEVRQFVGNGVKTLVPRVIGQTEQAVHKKRGDAVGRPDSTEAQLLNQLRSSRPEIEVSIVSRLLECVRRLGFEDRFLTGTRCHAYSPVLKSQRPLEIEGLGDVLIRMAPLRHRSPFNNRNKREEFRIQLQGLVPPEKELEGYVRFSIAKLVDENRYLQFTNALTWMANEIQSTN